jgi:dolichol-phosphate mannosyltransferase
VIRRTGERGLATAVTRGYQAAQGEILGTINADFQHPPEVLEAMIDRARESDIVVASRFCAGGGTGDWQLKRLLMSRVAHMTGKAILPNLFSCLSDPLSGCYLFRRTVMEGIPMSPTGFKTLIEIMARGRATSISECPYEMEARRKGASKATLSSLFSYLRQLRQLKTVDGA